MADRPIIFNSEMVRAILDDRKTQTRRVIKPQPYRDDRGWLHWKGKVWVLPMQDMCAFNPYGLVGNRLWVREAFNDWDGVHIRKPRYRATEENYINTNWKPSIHMPKLYTRLWLEITGIRVERVQDISEEDCHKEGVNFLHTDMEEGGAIKNYFSSLWDSINAKRGYSWESNPWVWVIEFRKV